MNISRHTYQNDHIVKMYRTTNFLSTIGLQGKTECLERMKK